MNYNHEQSFECAPDEFYSDYVTWKEQLKQAMKEGDIDRAAEILLTHDM